MRIPGGFRLLFAGGLLLVACGEVPPTQTPVYIVVTATSQPVPPTAVPTRVPPTVAAVPTSRPPTIPPTRPPSTATAVPTHPPETPTLSWENAQATAQARADALYHATETVAAEPRVLTAVARSVAATETAIGPPPTGIPATPLPGIGSTILLDDWRLSIAKLTSTTEVVWSEYGNAFLCNGRCWILYLDARNTANATRSLDGTFTFTLTDDHTATYPEFTASQSYEMESYAQLLGRQAVDIGVTPRKLAHAVLIFDVATDAQPAVLTIADRFGGPSVDVVLGHKR